MRCRIVAIGVVASLTLVLPAGAEEPDVTRITVVKAVTATSTLAGKNDHYGATHILDPENPYTGDPPETAWCEGKPDQGIGEAVTIAFDAPVKVAELTIKAGFWKTEALFRKNNIVTGLDVITDDGRTKSVVLPAAQEEVIVELGGAAVKTLSLKITKVKKGKMNDSCIASVVVRTEPESHVVLGMDPGLAAAIPRVERALARCDEKELAAVVAFPFTFAPLAYGEEEEAPKQEKVSYKTAAAMAAACKKGERRTPEPTLPGFDSEKKNGVLYLTDGSCGADCLQWGFSSKGNAWRLVWVGPMWVDPTP